MKQRLMWIGIGGAVVLLAFGLGLVWAMFPNARAQAAERSDADQIELMGEFEVPTSTEAIVTQPPVTSATVWRNSYVIEPAVTSTDLVVRVPVLMYHRLEEPRPGADTSTRLMAVAPETFVLQMQEIVDNGYTTITPDQLTAALTGAPLPPKPVLITFDDGFRTQYEQAYPVLKKLGLKATFFIITGYIGYPAYMDAAQLKDMVASGVATIGSHTITHPALAQISEEQRQHELIDSKATLETLLSVPVTTIAYPYGSHDDQVVKDAISDGYTSAYATFTGAEHTSASRYELRRIRVDNDEQLVPLLQYFASH